MKEFLHNNDLSGLIMALEHTSLFVPETPLIRYLLSHSGPLPANSPNSMEWSLVSTGGKIPCSPTTLSSLNRFIQLFLSKGKRGLKRPGGRPGKAQVPNFKIFDCSSTIFGVISGFGGGLRDFTC